MRQRIIAAGLTFVVLVIASSPTAFAQTDSRSGCARDVSRMCRAVMDSGDMAVLACLKQHRSRLSRACEKVLTDNGQ